MPLSMPPLFLGQELDFSSGTWDEPPPSAEPAGIFIGGLHSSVTQPLLTELCVQFGPLDGSGNAVRLLKDNRGQPKGVAFVDYAEAASALYATAVLNGLCLAGQAIRVNPAGSGAPPRPQQAFIAPQWSTRTASGDRRDPMDSERSRRYDERPDDRRSVDDRRHQEGYERRERHEEWRP